MSHHTFIHSYTAIPLALIAIKKYIFMTPGRLDSRQPVKYGHIWNHKNIGWVCIKKVLGEEIEFTL